MAKNNFGFYFRKLEFILLRFAAIGLQNIKALLMPHILCKQFTITKYVNALCCMCSCMRNIFG